GKVHIIQWSVSGIVDSGTGWIPWEEGDVVEYLGSIMDQAVYARNAWVEEQLGVTITAEYVSVNQGYDNRLRQDYTTSGNEFQLATLRSRNVWPLIETGMYVDMNQYAGEILHTDQPWWPADAVASYTLGDSLYVCVTEMLMRDKGATSCVFFNTRIANDHGMNYFYDLVENQEWTMEYMISAGEVVATSLDGDDLMNSARDLWGVEGGEASYQLYAGGGYKFAHIDDDGYLAYDFGTPETILAMQRIYEDYMYQDWNYISHMPVADAPSEGGLFLIEQALFANMGIKNGYLDYRKMETDYGILPVPMLEEGQDRYYSLVAVHHDSTVGIPAGALDPELAATVLEMISYDSYYTVRPVLYETLLLNRLAKSEESKRSLEIVLDTRVYDPGQYWDLENNLQGGKGFFRLSQTGNANIASVWDSWEGATMEQVGVVNDFIKATK
ncbi:MAG: hypothetical protein J6R04_03755, partial [Clostridia bacterium]|nr:hypothetical protein [Clostridia bacterium]